LIPNMIKKSNFWISLYMFHYLNDVITHVCYKIEGASILKEKTLIIIPDDCSYSGTQIISHFSVKTPHHILFAIPYISKEAKERIEREILQEEKILFCESTIEFKKWGDLWPIYFDHKLADEISTYQLAYAIGKDIFYEDFKSDPGFKYEPMSLIKGCNLPEVLLRDNKMNIYEFYTDDILKVVGVDEMCPPPFYKKIEYTFRGKPLDHIIELAEK